MAGERMSNLLGAVRALRSTPGMCSLAAQPRKTKGGVMCDADSLFAVLHLLCERPPFRNECSYQSAT
jgi:hypothetical protein